MMTEWVKRKKDPKHCGSTEFHLRICNKEEGGGRDLVQFKQFNLN